MKFNPEINNRKSNRLKEYDYSQPGYYHVTICTLNRKYLFGDIVEGKMVLNFFGEIVDECINQLPHHFAFTEIDYYCIMPNHVHLIIIINESNSSNTVGAIHELPLHLQRRKMLLPKIIGFTKMNSAKRINEIRNSPGIAVWQRNYYEHIIRNEKELYEIRKYVENNPLNWNDDEYNN